MDAHFRKLLALSWLILALAHANEGRAAPRVVLVVGPTAAPGSPETDRGNTPSDSDDTPAVDGDAPANRNAPAADSDAPADPEAPAVDGDTPADPEAPDSEAPAVEAEAPAADSDTPGDPDAAAPPPPVPPEKSRLELSIVPRLKSELIATGFDVTTVPVSEPPSRDGLEAIAQQTDSIAAIGVAEPADRVMLDIWVADRVTGKMVIRRVDTRELTPRAVALRAVELLRASLLEIHEPHPPRGQKPAPEPVRKWVEPARPKEPAPAPPPPAPEPERPRSAATVGVGVLGGPGGLGAAVVPSLRVAWRPEPPWETSIRFVGPALGSVSDSSGSARTDQELIVVTFGVAAPTDPIEPYAALGFGAYHLGARGEAAAPFRGNSGDAFGGLGLIAGGVRFRLTRALALFAEMDAGLVLPRAALRFARSVRARSGQPLFSGTVGGEIRW